MDGCCDWAAPSWVMLLLTGHYNLYRPIRSCRCWAVGLKSGAVCKHCGFASVRVLAARFENALD